MIQMPIKAAIPYLQKGKTYLINPYPQHDIGVKAIEGTYVGNKNEMADGKYIPPVWNEIFSFKETKGNPTFNTLLNSFFDALPAWAISHRSSKTIGVDNQAIITLEMQDLCY